MPQLSRLAKLAARLALGSTVLSLGSIAYAVLTITCCSDSGQRSLGGWVVLGALTLVAALLAAAVVGAVAEIGVRFSANKKRTP